MSESNIYEAVLSVVDHQTDNRVQGPTVRASTVVQLLSHNEYSPNQITDAIATLVERGDLEAADQNELRRA